MTSDRRFVGLALAIVLASATAWGLPALLAGTASAADAIQCLRAEKPPAPPAGDVVLARTLNDSVPGPNVAVIPVGWQFDAIGPYSCPGQPAGNQILEHPESIMVGAGAAVLFDGDVSVSFPPNGQVSYGVFSAWGAKDVPLGGPTPILTSKGFAGGPNWVPTGADVVSQKDLLLNWDSCRQCSLPGITYTPKYAAGVTVQPVTVPHLPRGQNLGIAFKGQVQGADLQAAALHGDFDHWDMSGADLSGAQLPGDKLTDSNLDHAIVSHTNFDGVDLTGTQLSSLRIQAPPSFAGVTVGRDSESCTVFRDDELFGAKLTIAAANGCQHEPLLPGSRTSAGVIASAVQHHVDNLSDAQFVATAGDRRSLAGADLSGINLDDASFTGFPIDLTKTIFDRAWLKKTSFDLADLAGASFQNATLTGASFRGADLASRGDVKGASFAGADTMLHNADFVDADVSGASFVGADLEGAVFSRALAVETNFNGVRAPNADFSGAHIYGDGHAFQGARNLQNASFAGAVLAGDPDVGGGFDFTGADLSGAHFNRTQCINCRFTGSSLAGVNFTGAYLPGATFAGVTSLKDAKLFNAWLFCGDQANRQCAPVAGKTDRWAWPLALGSDESFGPVPFANSDLASVPLDDVTDCPDGKAGATQPAGCVGHLLPDGTNAPPLPAPCSATTTDACPTRTSTVLDTAKLGTPLAVASTPPVTWATTLTPGGIYAGFDDGTIRQVRGGAAALIAGDPKQGCAKPTDSCGDGGPAKAALLGRPAGLAVGLDGSVYIADPQLHRVRRIDPSGTITTIAGDGSACAVNNSGCGDGGPATKAKLAGPYGVWVSPAGRVFIADGSDGVREVQRDGTIVTAGAGNYDVRSVVGDASGNVYAG